MPKVMAVQPNIGGASAKVP